MNIFINRIQSIISFFHKPFARIMPIQTFRYAVTGSINTSLDIFLYFIGYNFVFDKQDFNLSFITISPHIAAFMLSFSVTFFTGFILNRTIAFTDSVLQKRVQMFRYMVIVAICIMLNYVFLKIFVEMMHIFPTPSKMMTTVIVIIFSYFAQKHYTFKAEKI